MIATPADPNLDLGAVETRARIACRRAEDGSIQQILARDDMPAMVAEVRRLRANAAYAKANLARVLCPWPFPPSPTRVAICTGGIDEKVFNIPWPLFEATVSALVDGREFGATTSTAEPAEDTGEPAP